MNCLEQSPYEVVLYKKSFFTCNVKANFHAFPLLVWWFFKHWSHIQFSALFSAILTVNSRPYVIFWAIFSNLFSNFCNFWISRCNALDQKLEKYIKILVFNLQMRSDIWLQPSLFWTNFRLCNDENPVMKLKMWIKND